MTCRPCMTCDIGFGLSPPCYHFFPKVDPFTEECLPCVPGQNYSAENDTSSCRSCGNCPLHVIVDKHYTPSQKTECKQQCEYPFYYENGHCIRCCPCVLGAVKEARCSKFGLLVSKCCWRHSKIANVLET